MNTNAPMIPLTYETLEVLQMRARADALFREARARRTVRDFSDRPIPLDVVRQCIHTAAQAPSGANKQPWTFVLVTDLAIKQAIRAAAEKEEREFYGGRAPQEWLDDLEPFATDAHKPFLERAPALIVVFSQNKNADNSKHYYVKESVGIATGMLLATLHQCGLATLTHTPSPMKFLGQILGRPAHEKAFLLIPVGYPEAGCVVPDITRKSLDEVLVEV